MLSLTKVKDENNRKLEDEEDPDDKNDEEPEEDDKMTHIRKRLFSIEDKVDHLLLHAGHHLDGHSLAFTPYGTHFVPQFKNKDSLNKRLTIMDHFLHPHMAAGVTGMGGGIMHPNIAMGLGHSNPLGYGLDHTYSMGHGFMNYMQMGGPFMNFGGLHSPYSYHSGLHIPYHGFYHPFGGLHHPFHDYGMHGGYYGGWSGRLRAMGPYYRHRDDVMQERMERHERHNREMNAIMSKDILPPSLEKPKEEKGLMDSLFLI